MKQTISFARKLNDDDTGFYFLGKQRQCNVAMVMLGVLARPVDLGEALSAISEATDAIPRFKDYLHPAPLDMAPPTWHRTEDFRIERIVSEVVLGANATWSDALAVVDRVQAEPFPDGRPPWELVLIRNVPDGKALMMMKVHHALSDGTALALMFARAFAPEIMESSGVELDMMCEAPRSNTALGTALRDYGGALALWLRSATTIGPKLARTKAMRQRELDTVRTLVAPQRRWPSTAYSRKRRLSGFRVPTECWREEAQLRGGGTNDLYLAIVAQVMRRYWPTIDLDATPLQIVMPMNARDDDGVQDGGNVTAVGVVELTGADSDLERLDNVRVRTSEAKRGASSNGRGLIAATTTLLPRIARAPLQFREFSMRDIVASNVPMPIPGKLCGVLFEMMFMIAPAIGTAVSFTLTNYGEHLYLASNADLGIIDDPDRLDRCITSTLRQLFDGRVETLRDGTMTSGAATSQA